MEYKYITNTSFDTVLNKLEETEIISERVLKILHSYVIKTVKDLSEVNSTEEWIETFESINDDFYDAVALYEPIFSKEFRIWLLRSFRKLENELIWKN